MHDVEVPIEDCEALHRRVSCVLQNFIGINSEGTQLWSGYGSETKNMVVWSRYAARCYWAGQQKKWEKKEDNKKVLSIGLSSEMLRCFAFSAVGKKEAALSRNTKPRLY